MKYTIRDIANLINGELIADENQSENIIDDFEFLYKLITNIKTAYISISAKRWEEFIGGEPNSNNGNESINYNFTIPGLVITESEIEDNKYNIPQIIVGNSIEAMKNIAIHMREEFKNPLIAITGSNGKSSTRIMLSHLLSKYKVFQNRGNDNTRRIIWLNLCKLIKKPDYAIFEISLNALNNRGNMSLIVKPDIAIITNIGEAHLSTLKNTQTVAEFKSRLLKGVSNTGTIIINNDTLHSDFLYEKALENTNKIMRYSISNTDKEASLVSVDIERGSQKIEVELLGYRYIYNINILGKGMVENSLAALLTLKVLELNIVDLLNKFKLYKSLPKVMEMTSIKNKDNQNITVIDDTHNASLPSYINAVESFNQQAKFYKGNKILVLGKISDMGAQTENIHEKLVFLIEESDADYILCIDDSMRPVSVKVRKKAITWYKEMKLLVADLVYYLNEDSLILFKSSVTNSSLPAVAKQFPHKYKMSDYEYNDAIYKSIANNGKSEWIIDLAKDKIIHENNIGNSGTIEGLNLLIYYIRYYELLSENKINKYKKIYFSKWPTNDAKYNADIVMSIQDLVNRIRHENHPTLIYELSKVLFKTSLERKKYIEDFIKENHLNHSVSINRTGRFRIKERQNFSVNELMEIAKNNKKVVNNNYIIFGDKYYHGIVIKDNIIGSFTSFIDIAEVKNFIDKVNKGESINEFKEN